MTAALTDVVVQNVVVQCDLLRYQTRRTITFYPPADHPAVLELLRWHEERLLQEVAAATDPPSFGPIG